MLKLCIINKQNKVDIVVEILGIGLIEQGLGCNGIIIMLSELCCVVLALIVFELY